MLLRETIRNIKRHKVRSLMVIFALALGLGMLSVTSNMRASMEATINSIVDKYSLEDIWFSFEKPQNESIINKLSSVEGVGIIEPKIYMWGSTIRNSTTYSVRIIGIPKDPKIGRVFLEGNTTWDAFHGNVCFVDEVVAERSGVKLGDEIKSVTRAGLLTFRVVGIVDAYWSLQMGYPITISMLVPLDSLQETLGWSGKINVVMIKVSEGYTPKQVYEKLESILKQEGLSYYGWYRESREAETMSTSGLAVFTIMFGPAIIVAAVIVMFAMFNKIAGEYRIFGIRKAVGFTPWQITKIILLEGVILYILSLPLGAVFSYLLTYVLMGYFKNFGLDINIVFDFEGFISDAIIASILVLLAILYPALKARKINALDAIRYGFEPPKYGGKAGHSRLPKLMSMAWRSITRRKKRTALMILALTLSTGFAFGLVMFRDSLVYTYYDLISTNFRADIIIAFNKTMTSDDVRLVNNISGVERSELYYAGAIAEKYLGVLVNNKSRDIGTIYHAMNIYYAYPNATLYKPRLAEGRWISEEGDIVISYRIAEYFSVGLGDKLTFIDSLHNKTYEFNVVGIAQIIFNDGWLAIAAMPKTLPEDFAPLLMIDVASGVKPETVADKVTELLASKRPTYVLLTKTLYEALEELTSTISLFLTTLVGVIVAVALIGTAGGFLLNVQERRWDVGLLKSIGGTTGDAVKVFGYELLFILVFSLVPGLLLGKVILDVLLMALSSSNMPMVIFPMLSSSAIAIALLIPASIVLASLVLVAYYSYRIRPVELLKKML